MLWGRPARCGQLPVRAPTRVRPTVEDYRFLASCGLELGALARCGQLTVRA